MEDPGPPTCKTNRCGAKWAADIHAAYKDCKIKHGALVNILDRAGNTTATVSDGDVNPLVN